MDTAAETSAVRHAADLLAVRTVFGEPVTRGDGGGGGTRCAPARWGRCGGDAGRCTEPGRRA